MDLEPLIEAGLYDPEAPCAQDRLDLLVYVLDAGASIDEMLEADRDGNLSSLATDLRLRRGELSATELAGRAGATLDDVVEAYRLLGVPVDDTAEQLFDEDEARLIEMRALGAATLPEGVTDEVMRSIGTALAMVAESAVAVFVGSFEDSLEDELPLHRAEVTTDMGELGLELGSMMGPLFRHHLRLAVLRQRAAMADRTGGRLDSKVTIGFVDLVGFTTASASMGSAELLEFMRRFHSLAYDVVTGVGGRVVKHIGDEIMFTAPEPAQACEIALRLIDAFGDPGSLPRGGLAQGTVIARHGDFYGTIVNLAARLADVAVPGEVLADAGLAAGLTDAPFTVEPAGRRALKGFAAPVSVVSVQRRSG